MGPLPGFEICQKFTKKTLTKLVIPDWSFLFGCCITKFQSKSEPLVSPLRQKFKRPADISRRRDFVKFVKTQKVPQEGIEKNFVYFLSK